MEQDVYNEQVGTLMRKLGSGKFETLKELSAAVGDGNSSLMSADGVRVSVNYMIDRMIGALEYSSIATNFRRKLSLRMLMSHVASTFADDDSEPATPPWEMPFDDRDKYDRELDQLLLKNMQNYISYLIWDDGLHRYEFIEKVKYLERAVEKALRKTTTEDEEWKWMSGIDTISMMVLSDGRMNDYRNTLLDLVHNRGKLKQVHDDLIAPLGFNAVARVKFQMAETLRVALEVHQLHQLWNESSFLSKLIVNMVEEH